MNDLLIIVLQGSVKEMLNLSQTDYVKRIDELNTVCYKHKAFEYKRNFGSLKKNIGNLFLDSSF